MSRNEGLSGTDTEQQQTEAQIFSEMSKAVKDNDSEALDRLTKEDAVAEDEGKEVEQKPTPTEEEKVVAKEGGSEEEVPKPELELDDKDKTINQLKEELANQSKRVHQLQSDAGRVPALQRRLSELDKKLQDMALKPQTAASTREDARVLSEKLAQIKEADPLLAEAVEEAITNALGNMRRETDEKLASTQEFLKQRAAKDDNEHLDREYSKLIEAVPNAPQVFAHPLWEEWKTQIPPNLYSLATSEYADEVMVAFEQFSKFVLRKHPELAAQQQQRQEEQKPVVKDPAAEKLAAEREKKLKTPTPGTSSAAAEKLSEPTDERKLFEHFYKLERKTFER